MEDIVDVIGGLSKTLRNSIADKFYEKVGITEVWLTQSIKKRSVRTEAIRLSPQCPNIDLNKILRGKEKISRIFEINPKTNLTVYVNKNSKLNIRSAK
ncbi:MAG: hypothetical protein NZ601_06045 [candidate division WOR-3 bacterium]|nr:hypothetical protein [candidate division WOR-3 bacterium]MCX7757377.1 hypothetical protein [candidate division WOR-3 bacterium]MDW7987745.1 hypothetical protein [candidate division WOR-3 bacterium]